MRLLESASSVWPGRPPVAVSVTVRAFIRFSPLRARKHSLQLIAIATLLTPLVLPEASPTELVALELGPGLVLLLNLRALPRADADDRRACARFVLLNGLALNLALVGWSVALALGAPA